MKPETEAKLVVAMVVSLVAFGFATGTVMVTGLIANGTPSNQLNVTKQSDFPVITSSKPNSSNTTKQSQVSSNIDTGFVQPSTDTSQNTNQNSNSQNQTGNSTLNQ